MNGISRPSGETDVVQVQVAGGSCSLFPKAPRWHDLPTAAFADLQCEDEEAARAAIGEATRVAARLGATALIGPMEGSTWHRYRYVVETDGSPAFFLEPQNSPECPSWVRRAGLQVIAEYASAIDTSITRRARSLGHRNVRIRSWDRDHKDRELAIIHQLASTAFATRPFFQPIPFHDFARLYQPILEAIDPELILIAESPIGAPVGFLFAVPDLLRRADQGAAGALPVIIKSYASLRPGVGAALVNRVYQVAESGGTTSIIHALFESRNLSARHSQRTGGRVFRRYALWGKRI